MPCAGTLAEMLPEVLVVASVQASRRVNELPLLPIAAAVVETVVVDPLWLNSATATSPSASRLARTRRVLSPATWVACRARLSWLIATRFWLRRMVSVWVDMERRSLPAISGAAMMAQRAKWLRVSVSVMPPLPTSIMSGSLNWPARRSRKEAR
ncbi:hypothetical protein Psuf_000090 [Phytohabitans suffuscus]|uniref:Uncharacterized protein n=1 Tax=Phytohabitans suffuscus TaxID=624315 RepID=A0A6F8Y9B4_9ACTN|nr:hypothetical protein Psuf_000090 [Phytohabitans suffuscus]